MYVIKNCALIIINKNIKQYNLKGNLFCKSYHNISNVESLTLTKHFTIPSGTYTGCIRLTNKTEKTLCYNQLAQQFW